MMDVDASLLTGFSFACRDDCGLCCFTSPRVDAVEERRLRTKEPRAEILSYDGERRLASRPDGGACQFLRHLRCAAHEVRPAPCREFPISVHIGPRLQASLVLSCPGVDVAPLASFVAGDARPRPVGLDTEMESVRSRLSPVAERRQLEAVRRRRKVQRDLRSQGRWVDDEELRARLAGAASLPTSETYSPSSPPEVEDGMELLPMYFDGRSGPVAVASGLGAWEFWQLREEGGPERISVEVPPDRMPSWDREGGQLLQGYLRYWIARDAFLAAVHGRSMESATGTLESVALEDLHGIASDVLARGSVRAKMRGSDGLVLTAGEVALGIRATDQDWLDRPTWGGRL